MVKIIGMKIEMLCDVSIMITASEYVILVYPARNEEQPRTTKCFLTSFNSLASMYPL